MIDILKRNTLIKYSTVGISGTAVDILVLYFLVDILGLGVILAASISFILAATNNFLWNNIWTFREDVHKRFISLRYIRFMIVSVIGLILTIFLMYIFNSILFIWYILAKIMTSIVVLLWNYYANKHWTLN